MTKLWLPNNIRMAELIMAHGELVIQNGMPECLIDLCAHTLIMKSYLAGLAEGGPIRRQARSGVFLRQDTVLSC